MGMGVKKCTLVQTHPVYYQSETENQIYLKQKITSSSIYNDHKRSQNIYPAKIGGPEKGRNKPLVANLPPLYFYIPLQPSSVQW